MTKEAKMIMQRMVKRVISQSKGEVNFEDVKKEAKKLGVTIKVKNLSFGKSGTYHDTKSKSNTNANVWPNTPQVKDFLQRLAKIKKFIGDRDVMDNGQKISGLK